MFVIGYFYLKMQDLRADVGLFLTPAADNDSLILFLSIIRMSGLES